jgi:hypothetical protein
MLDFFVCALWMIGYPLGPAVEALYHWTPDRALDLSLDGVLGVYYAEIVEFFAGRERLASYRQKGDCPNAQGGARNSGGGGGSSSSSSSSHNNNNIGAERAINIPLPDLLADDHPFVQRPEGPYSRLTEFVEDEHFYAGQYHIDFLGTLRESEGDSLAAQDQTEAATTDGGGGGKGGAGADKGGAGADKSGTAAEGPPSTARTRNLEPSKRYKFVLPRVLEIRPDLLPADLLPFHFSTFEYHDRVAKPDHLPREYPIPERPHAIIKLTQEEADQFPVTLYRPFGAHANDDAKFGHVLPGAGGCLLGGGGNNSSPRRPAAGHDRDAAPVCLRPGHAGETGRRAL